MPTPVLAPAVEVQKAIVDALRADATMASLLFPSHSPSQGPLDFRVYGAAVELPEMPALRDAMPRVLVETIQFPFGVEQLDAFPLQAEVVVYLHSMAGRQDEQLAEQLDARATVLLLSTSLSSVRIIASGLSYEGQRRKGRVGSLDDAWEIVTQFRSPHVGVLP